MMKSDRKYAGLLLLRGSFRDLNFDPEISIYSDLFIPIAWEWIYIKFENRLPSFKKGSLERNKEG